MSSRTKLYLANQGLLPSQKMPVLSSSVVVLAVGQLPSSSVSCALLPFFFGTRAWLNICRFQSGYKGKITMLTKEPYQPIDRTKLSKALITDAGKIALRAGDQLNSEGVTLKHIGAASIDKANKTVKLEDGSSLSYSHLVLAPGAYPTKLPIEGVQLQNIHTLRKVPDAKAISDAMGEDQTKNVVILGGSFIGTELATASVSRAKSVTVVEPAYPMKAVLGDAIAKRLVALYEEKGVKFIIGQGSVKRFVPSSSDPNKVAEAELDNGTKIPADVVVLATGVKPATDFLKGTFSVQKDGGIDVDHNLLVQGETDIYAIGDIARFKDPSTGSFGRIEHWNIAQNRKLTQILRRLSCFD